MKKSGICAAVLSALFASLVASCVSLPPSSTGPAASPAASAAADALLTMRELRDAARAAFDSNHPIEAVRHLVGLLAVDAEAAQEKVPARAAERSELARAADAELTAIGARFVMEPTDEWLSGGKQITGNLRDLAKGGGLKPSVRLVINYDFGKAVVQDAPIRFAFVAGIGELTAAETTDSYGTASAVVRGISRTDAPVVIRATLAVSNRGKTKVFSEVFRDFSFLPSSRTAKVLAFERVVGADKKIRAAGDHSPLVDAVSRGLAASGLELVPVDGALDPASFTAALGGDPAAVGKALALGGKSASFLAIAASDCDEPRQMVLNGKTYEIYTANVRVTVRLLRSDGSVVESRPQASLRAQGGTPDAAIQAAFKAAREAIEKDLREAGEKIRSSLD
jgi:hypothetical protein